MFIFGNSFFSTQKRGILAVQPYCIYDVCCTKLERIIIFKKIKQKVESNVATRSHMKRLTLMLLQGLI